MDKSTRRQFLIAGSSLMAAGALANYRIPQAGAQDTVAPKRGGDLTILWTSDFVSMDPIHSNGTTRAAIYDWLFAWRPDETGIFTVQPYLATEWTTTDTAITIKLRDDVTFHDGSPLTAEVVRWNIARMVQNETSYAANYFPAIDPDNPATVIDDHTVQINTTRPSASILVNLSDVTLETAIVSKQAADDHGEDWLQQNPVGSGPFKFVSWTSGDSLKVTRNENYWQMGADGQPLPYVDSINYRIIVSIDTEFAEMRAGTSDFMRNLPGRNVSTAKGLSDVTYYDAPLLGLRRQYFFNATRPPFQDNLKLRQAFHHAIDRDSIAKALGGDLGLPLPYEFVPGTLGYSTDVPFYDFNLDTAKQLIAESGVELPLQTTLTVHSRDTDQQQAQIIQAMVKEIGIDLQIEVLEDVAWGEKVRVSADYEVATRQSGTQADPTAFLLLTWAPSGNSAYSRADVPGLLDLIAQADATYDQNERQQLFVQAQGLMYESAWFGYMWYENGNVLAHKRVQGMPIANDAPAIWGALREWEWWINE
jgi:peptide/nickel transport system substrate-binding protein